MSLDTKLWADQRVEEYRAVLIDAATRYAALFPDTLSDWIAESIETDATFGQGWGSTCGGFPGIGGQMMTGSQTWVIRMSGSRIWLVYFGARLAHATEDEVWVAECIKKRRFPCSHMPPIKPGEPITFRPRA